MDMPGMRVRLLGFNLADGTFMSANPTSTTAWNGRPPSAPAAEDFEYEGPNVSWHWIRRRNGRWPGDWRCWAFDLLHGGGAWYVQGGYTSPAELVAAGWEYHSEAWPRNTAFKPVYH